MNMLEIWDGLKMTYGDFISHNEIETHFLTKRPHIRNYQADGNLADYDKAVEKWNLQRMATIEKLKEALLIEREMYLISVRGDGYRVATPKDQVSIAANKFRDAVLKEAGKLKQAAAKVNIDAIEDRSERARVMRQQDQAQGLAMFISGRTAQSVKLLNQ